MAADYMCNVTEGIRRLLPYRGNTAPFSTHRKVALTPIGGRGVGRWGGASWREPASLRIEPNLRYRKLTIVPAIRMGNRRDETEMSFYGYIGGRKRDPREGGCDSEQEEENDRKTETGGTARITDQNKQKTVSPTAAKRKYHLGGRVSRSGRNLAITHTPISKDGTRYMRCGYNSHAGRRRNAARPNAHQHLKPSGMRWAVSSELYRRGGRK